VIFPMRAIRPAERPHPVDPNPHSNRADDSNQVGAVVGVQEFRRHSGRVVVVIQGVSSCPNEARQAIKAARTGAAGEQGQAPGRKEGARRYHCTAIVSKTAGCLSARLLRR
jgi:hypothetical protein